MNIGIIGTGNMGSILLESLVESEAISPDQLLITNRTIAKAKRFQDKYPEIQVTDTAVKVAQNTDLVFICVKPLDIHPLLEKINSTLTEKQCIISITSPISVSELESMVNCSVARVIPSITNRAFSGTSLLTFGEKCSEAHQETIESLMNNISTPVKIEQNVTRIASDITSCAPAFFTYLVRRFIESAVEETEISEEQATLLASKMLVGLGNLIEKDIFTLPTLQEKVCVKGGITGEGIKVLEKEVGQMFNQLIQATHNKYYHDREKVEEQFGTYHK